MRFAKDLMTKNPKVIKSGQEVQEALQYFLSEDLHFAPVITPLNEILGIVTDFILVKSALRDYMTPGTHDKIIHNQELFEAATFVNEEDSLDEVIRQISKAPSHRLVVINKMQKLVGVISPRDIARLMGGNDKASLSLKEELQKTRDRAENLEEKVEDLQASLQIYQGLFADSPYMMHSVDEKGVIVMANKKVHDMLGYDVASLVGQNISVLYPKSVLHEALAGLNTIKENGFHHVTYTTMVRKNGDKVRIDIASSSLRDRNGKFLSTISISRVVDSEELLRALNGVVGARKNMVKDASEED
jgi:PAS domain S-box-containing protein